MRTPNQPLVILCETTQGIMACTWMSWTDQSTCQAALVSSSAPPSETESRCLQVRPMGKERLTLFRVCPAPDWDGFATNVVSRRRERRTASNTQDTAAPRCSFKASTHYAASPSGSRWQTIDPAHDSDAFHSKHSTNRVQLCTSAVHEKRTSRSSGRT